MRTLVEHASQFDDSDAQDAVVYGPPKKVADYLKDAMAGKKLFIESKGRYPILIRAFRRLCARERITGKRLCIRKVNVSKWRVLIVDKKQKERPEVEFEDGFETKHGRYKRWARELNEAGFITIPFDKIDLRINPRTKKPYNTREDREASKVMAAWRLYYPPEVRANKRLTKQRLKKSKAWNIMIMDASG